MRDEPLTLYRRLVSAKENGYLNEFVKMAALNNNAKYHSLEH